MGNIHIRLKMFKKSAGEIIGIKVGEKGHESEGN